MTISTPIAKSERSSRKSSTAKSPSSCDIPIAAGTVIAVAIIAIISAGFAFPQVAVRFFSQCSGIKCGECISILLFFLLAIHSSILNRIRGTHNPVRRNAERIPRAASIPNERKAAISLNKLAAKAAIVVREVSIIALPTRLSVVSVASLVEAPFFLSSLYLCKACRESSIPKASTRMGRRFEN